MSMKVYQGLFLQQLAGLIQACLVGSEIAFFEQASVLATTWANRDELKAFGAKHSLCVICRKRATCTHKAHACSSRINVCTDGFPLAEVTLAETSWSLDLLLKSLGHVLARG